MSWKLGADQERDGNDHVERHVYSSMKITSMGAQVTVNGNGTTDTDVPVIHTGALHNLPEGTNADIYLVGNGADTNLKLAIICGPRDKIYQSKPGESWSQDPTNPMSRVGHTPNGVRLAADPSSQTIAEYLSGMLEIDVKNQMIYFRVPVITSSTITQGTPPPYKK